MANSDSDEDESPIAIYRTPQERLAIIMQSLVKARHFEHGTWEMRIRYLFFEKRVCILIHSSEDFRAKDVNLIKREVRQYIRENSYSFLVQRIELEGDDYVQEYSSIRWKPDESKTVEFICHPPCTCSDTT